MYYVIISTPRTTFLKPIVHFLSKAVKRLLVREDIHIRLTGFLLRAEGPE